jgi:transposase-like protein
MSRQPTSNVDYVQEKGLQCPYCRSTDIEGSEVVIDEGKAYQKVGCNDCDKEWTDTYVLTGWEAV